MKTVIAARISTRPRKQHTCWVEDGETGPDWSHPIEGPAMRITFTRSMWLAGWPQAPEHRYSCLSHAGADYWDPQGQRIIDLTYEAWREKMRDKAAKQKARVV